MRARLAALGLALLPLLAACPHKPEGLEVVRDFEVERYLGRWHEVARLDNRFERGLVEVTAEYSRRKDGGIDVRNQGWDCKVARWSAAQGRAYFVGAKDVGELKVSFFRPFYSSYNIALLDSDYRYAMVVGDERRYFWILARTPELSDDIRQQLLAQAVALGVDPSQLIFPGARTDCHD